MSVLILSRSDLWSAGTLAPMLLPRTSPVLLLVRSPTYEPVGNVPPATAVTYFCTESVRPLVTLARNTSQYCAALTQPSVSTHMTETLPPEALAAAAEPMPVPPATGKITSAPCEMKAWEIDLPLFWSVKDCANVPAFCLFSSQPRTCTVLFFCLL